MAAWLSLKQNKLTVDRLVVSTTDSKLEAQGEIRNFQAPKGEFSYHGSIQIAELRPLYPKGRQLKGAIQVDGSLNLSEDRWAASGILEGTKLLINDSAIARLSSRYEFRPERLQFDQIKIAGLHGRAEGSFVVESPFWNRQYATDLKFGDVGLLDLSSLAGLEKARFTGQINGSLKATWRDGWKRFSGQGQVVIAESPSEIREHAITGKILPVSGQVNFYLSEWSSRFDRTFLKLGQTQLQVVGTLSVKDSSNLRFEVRSEDLSDFQFLIPQLEGKASVVGVFEGRRNDLSARGSFLVEDLNYHPFRLDQASGRFKLDRRAMDLLNVDLVQGNSQVMARGQLFLDPARWLPTGEMHILINLRNAAIQDLMVLLGEKHPVSGQISGDFMATGKYPHVALQGLAQVREGQFLEQKYDSGRFEVHYQDSLLQLPEWDVRIGSGQIRGSAEINLSAETVRTKLSGTELPIEKIHWLQFPNNPLTGRFSTIAIALDGPYRRPALEGEVKVSGLSVAGETLGDFRTQFRTQAQILRFQTDSLTPAIDLRAVGSVDLNDNLDCIAQVSFKNFALTPYVKKVLPVVPETLSSQAEGQVVLSGPLVHWDKLVLNGRLHSLRVDFREAQLQSARPFDIEVRDERVNVKNALFTGKGTVLNLDGLLDLSRKQRLEFTLQGDFDLALLNEFVKKLSASGNGTVNASIRGTLGDPRIQGQARINNGQFSHADLPNSFSQMNGTLFFDEDQVKIDNLTAMSGGGRIQASGDVVFGDEQIKLFNLRIQGREVRIRYPEGMRNVVDADLVLRGSQQSQLMSGNVRIVSASFQKGYDPITRFLEERNSRTSWSGVKEYGETLNLDLTITGDRNIKLDTNIIKMTSRADLKVKGTASNPLVTGSIEASGGELFFQGARYRITRGRLEFVNPVRIDPRIDLEAETDVRDYRIVLTLNGTLDRFRADLRSDPPLPTVDLFSLVSAGGTGGGGLSGSSYRPFATTGRQQDSSLGAASLLSEGLSMQVGSRVKRIFGLDRFRVDPFLVGNERDPSARVTFGQQITKDLSITYSTSVSSNEQQVILLEYNLSDRMSVIASRDAEGSFGLDIRFRKRLGQKKR
jgi:translocation and assembly module TamB